MPKLKVLSGQDLVKIFTVFGFIMVSQKGSHMKLRRVLASGHKQILTIPAHKEIDKGLLRAILKQSSEFISTQELDKYFYSE